MRILFFTLASAWGFVIGSAAVIVALRIQIPSFQLRPPVLLVLVAAGLVSVAGGVLAAIAYRQSMGQRPPG